MGFDQRDAASGAGRHLRPLAVSLGLIAAFTAVEIAAGVWTGSLALISDAGHMAADTLGLAMALAAVIAGRKVSAGGTRTFGLYRLEVLAALANAALLLAVGGYVVYEAIRRAQAPPDVLTVPMLVVAVGGLSVNLVAWRLLRPGSQESLNLQGAHLEVLADLAGSIGVVLAAVIMILTGWPYADPLFAAMIGIFIVPRASRLGARAVRVLVQAAPEDIDIRRLESDLAAVEGVIDVHDLHVWTLTSEMNVASVHLMTTEQTDAHLVLDRARSLLQGTYDIEHATLQVEPETHRSCSEMSW